MRILIVDTCYSKFLARHYERYPQLARRPYDEQWRSLMTTHFGTADSHSHHLGLLGVDAHEIVANCSPLQTAWAQEHGHRVLRRGRRPSDEIVMAQAEAFGPDVVYVQNLSYLRTRTLARLRRLGARLVGQIATEAPPWRRLRLFDLILSSFPHFVERFVKLGLAAAYFRIGFDDRILRRLESEAAPTSIGGALFVGALSRRQWSRANPLLERAARLAPIEFMGYGLQGWSRDSPIRLAYRGEAWGLDMYRALRAARIAVNRHGDVSEDYANNMRLYEATGVGALLLTDNKRNLGELFTPGTECVTYDDEYELAEQILHYLSNDDERSAIAAAGQRRTLEEHTYAVRMRELLEILGSP
jgi:spore maturation protein CgeB